MIQAIFFDIDGTLVSFHTHEVPTDTFEILKQLKQQGIKLFIATGRGKDGLAVLKDFPFDGYITLNGQYCFTNDGNVIYENTIPHDQLEIIVNYSKEHPFPCGYVMENNKIFNFRDERVDAIHAITLNDNHPAGDTSNIVNEKIYQIMAFLDEQEEKELLAYMPNCHSARWHPTFCDISPKGGTKVKGIDTFLKYYNIPLENTMAFGDGGNDLEMLQHVPLSVAMGNGAEALKKIATFITKDVDEQGISYAIKELGIIKA